MDILKVGDWQIRADKSRKNKQMKGWINVSTLETSRVENCPKVEVRSLVTEGADQQLARSLHRWFLHWVGTKPIQCWDSRNLPKQLWSSGMLQDSTARIGSPGLGRARASPEKSDMESFSAVSFTQLSRIHLVQGLPVQARSKCFNLSEPQSLHP